MSPVALIICIPMGNGQGEGVSSHPRLNALLAPHSELPVEGLEAQSGCARDQRQMCPLAQTQLHLTSGPLQKTLLKCQHFLKGQGSLPPRGQGR